jgi:hypothetical protein
MTEKTSILQRTYSLSLEPFKRNKKKEKLIEKMLYKLIQELETAMLPWIQHKISLYDHFFERSEGIYE